jgi:molybdenum cofactor guanylyltransferase
MEPIAATFSAALLAGGRSIRMGRDKAQIPVTWNGYAVPLWARQLGLLQSLGPIELFYSVSTPVDQVPGARIVVDQWPHAGPLSAIASCLQTASSDLVLFLAVDVARIDVLMLKKLLMGCQTGVGIVPRIGERYEPLVAVYPRLSLPFAVEQISRDELRPQDLVHRLLQENLVRIYPVRETEVWCFANWNRPEDVGER